MVLAGKPEGALLLMGIECSTFVAISKGTHRRDALLPWGDELKPSVVDANVGTSRWGLQGLNFPRTQIDMTYRLEKAWLV